MKLSVIIPCYNFERFVGQCIDSVLSQKTDFDFEVIVGDDASTDASHSVLEEYSDRIRYYVNEENLGIAKNTRKLLGMCSGEYISYIDGDDFFTDVYKLQMQVDFLDSNPDYVMHSTGCFYATPEGDFSGTIISPLVEEPTTEDLLHVNYVGFGRTFRRMPDLSPEWMDCIKFHDWAMNFEISLRGRIKCQNITTGGYRISGTGIITGLDESQIHDHNSFCSDALRRRLERGRRPVALVTGGCGFIGGHLVDRLVVDGFRVVVVDDMSSPEETFHENDKAEYHRLDINDRESVAHLFDGVDYVFHMAAESRIQRALADPDRAYRVNVMGTLNVLELCAEKRVRRLVYSSTSSVYGLSRQMPSVEHGTLDCLNPYSHSKFLGEELVRQYHKLGKVDSVILRYFNVFGERAPRTGSYAPVVGIFMQDSLMGRPLSIVGDGSKRRDFVHVSDVVDANLLSVFKSMHDTERTINVGTGRNYSIKEIADAVSQDQIHVDDRVGEAAETLACTEIARRVLGFEATVDVIDWIKHN